MPILTAISQNDIEQALKTAGPEHSKEVLYWSRQRSFEKAYEKADSLSEVIKIAEATISFCCDDLGITESKLQSETVAELASKAVECEIRSWCNDSIEPKEQEPELDSSIRFGLRKIGDHLAVIGKNESQCKEGIKDTLHEMCDFLNKEEDRLKRSELDTFKTHDPQDLIKLGLRSIRKSLISKASDRVQVVKDKLRRVNHSEAFLKYVRVILADKSHHHYILAEFQDVYKACIQTMTCKFPDHQIVIQGKKIYYHLGKAQLLRLIEEFYSSTNHRLDTNIYFFESLIIFLDKGVEVFDQERKQFFKRELDQHTVISALELIEDNRLNLPDILKQRLLYDILNLPTGPVYPFQVSPESLKLAEKLAQQYPPVAPLQPVTDAASFIAEQRLSQPVADLIGRTSGAPFILNSAVTTTMKQTTVPSTVVAIIPPAPTPKLA